MSPNVLAVAGGWCRNDRAGPMNVNTLVCMCFGSNATRAFIRYATCERAPPYALENPLDR